MFPARSAELTNNSRNNFTHSLEILPFLEFYRTFLLRSERQTEVPAVAGGSRKPSSALGFSNISPLLPWILGVGKCLQLVFKLISHAYSNDNVIAFQPNRYLTRDQGRDIREAQVTAMYFFIAAFLRAS